MNGLVYWHWLTLALLLFIAETLGAAGFLVALGMAAALTGFIQWLFVLNLEWQLTLFSMLCVFFAVGWWFLLKHDTPEQSHILNRPLESMLGQNLVLQEAIENGRGLARFNDAVWYVTGPDLAAGSRVKIIGIEGNLLRVEPV